MGSKTFLPDVGLSLGPNVVMGLSETRDLCIGTCVFTNNLFTLLDLIHHLG